MNKPFIHPELQPILDKAPQRPCLSHKTLSAFRKTKLTLDHRAHFPDALDPICHVIDGAYGAINVYEFRPSGTRHSSAAILWLHGGGYVTGHGNDLWFGSLFAEKAGVRVYSVDYRLAPEHAFPAALNDSWAALCWVFDNHTQLGVDLNRIAIGGASAGGGLAASLAIYGLDCGGPELAFQLLLYPMLDNRHDNPAGNMDVPRWPKKNSLQAWQMYLGSTEPHPHSVPSLKSNLSGLPPTFLTVGEADLFLDDIRQFSARLKKASVPHKLHTYAGVFHAAEMQGYDTTIGRTMTNDYVNALATALHTTQ